MVIELQFLKFEISNYVNKEIVFEQIFAKKKRVRNKLLITWIHDVALMPLDNAKLYEILTHVKYVVNFGSKFANLKNYTYAILYLFF